VDRDGGGGQEFRFIQCLHVVTPAKGWRRETLQLFLPFRFKTDVRLPVPKSERTVTNS